MKNSKKRIAVLISGSGSNLQAIIDSVKNNEINAEISIVISNKDDAYGLERAQKAGINTIVIKPGDFEDRLEYDESLIKALKIRGIELVVLAGYMLICTKIFVDEYFGKLINLHPSLLPSFPGANSIDDAFEYGVKVTGVTVHFVDEGCDTGPIILQEVVSIKTDDTKETLAKKIHEVEHNLLPKAIKLFCDDKLEIDGRKVTQKGSS